MKTESPQLLCFNGDFEKLSNLLSLVEGKEGTRAILSKDTEGRVALHYAVYSTSAASLKCGEMLLDNVLTRELMLNLRDNYGLAPLHIAAFRFYFTLLQQFSNRD
jgi:ankyrin repeat protein